MKKVGVIAAMQEELHILKESIKEATHHEYGQYEFIEGKINNQEVVIVQSGIGKVNASIATVLLIQEYGCELIINTGSGGGVGEELEIGDVVLSTTLSYYDADARVFGYKMGQIPQMPAEYLSSKEAISQMKKAAKKAGLSVVEGEILTGDSFVSGGEKMKQIQEYFPQAQIVEMEGAAVAQVCADYQVPCLVVRAVSDTANNEAAQSFDDFIIEAGRKSGEMILYFLELIE